MKKNDKLQSLRWIVARARGLYGRIGFLTAASAIASLTAVGYAICCKGIVDEAQRGSAEGVVRHIILIALLLATDIVLIISRNLLEERATTALQMNLQRHIFRVLLNREHSNVSSYHSGELLNRMCSDAEIVASGTTGLLPSLSGMLARLIGAAGALFVLAPGFMALFLLAGAALFAAMTLLRKPIRRLHRLMQDAQGQNRSFIQESLERLLVIRVFGAEESVLSRIQAHQEHYSQRKRVSHRLSVLSNTGFRLVFTAGHILALVFGSIGILNGVLTYGTLMAMVQLVGQVQSPFSGLSGVMSRYFTVTASAERLMELEELPQEAAQTPLAYDSLSAIRFDHVDFTYGRSDVLLDVDFTLKRGDVVSFTGISGGGKSTLFLLLLGAYRPTRGAVRFITQEDPQGVAPGDATRSLFAYVPQGNYLMSGTLRENLTFFRADVAEEELWQALSDACAADFVRELPQGLDTLLGEKGHGLSEGQMQRIAVARALLSGAPILLLDEATSALDEATEARLLHNIAQLRGRTCLIVTHRPQALAICSRHLTLEDGRVRERVSGENT